MPETKTVIKELTRHRFILAMISISVASAALLMDKMNGAEWNMAIGLILGAYGVAAISKVN